MIIGLHSAGISLHVANASTTSKYNGSPFAPGSFVLSSTQIRFTVSGMTAPKYFTENGR